MTDESKQLKQIAEMFPITNHCTYLNNAGLSPLSTLVKTAMVEAIDEACTNTFAQEGWQEKYRRTRAKVAELIHCDPTEIAFIRSTSEGLSAILNGIQWEKGDNVVSYSGEHPSVLYNCLRLSDQFGVRVKLAHDRNGLPNTDELISLIDEHTKVLLISWVQYSSGFRSILREIGLHCRERDILFIVDAVQGVGALTLDVHRECVDACAAGANKFLLGPEGIGFMFIDHSLLHRLKPSVVGWRSVKDYGNLDNHEFIYNDGALRFEYGTLNSTGVSGLEAAIGLLMSIGPKAVEDYLLRLNQHLVMGLRAKNYVVCVSSDFSQRSAIVSCSHPRISAEEVQRHLHSHRIETSSRSGRLRISPHVYNTLADIDKLLRVIPD
jgi:cysteine desulfurase / selenocysteine lyase